MAEAEPDLSTFENKSGLAEDMKFLASMPELCDVTFLVGDTREPVCAVKAVLAARSRVFHKMLYQVDMKDEDSHLKYEKMYVEALGLEILSKTISKYNIEYYQKQKIVWIRKL